MEAGASSKNVGNGTSGLEDPKVNEIGQRILAYLEKSRSRYNTASVIAESIGSYPKVVERHLQKLMAKGLVRFREDTVTNQKFYLANEDEEDEAEEVVEQVLEEVHNGSESSGLADLVKQLGDTVNGYGWEIEIRIRRGPCATRTAS